MSDEIFPTVKGTGLPKMSLEDFQESQGWSEQKRIAELERELKESEDQRRSLQAIIIDLNAEVWRLRREAGLRDED
jgi:septal ring factor EnvC (AmiA/AmiB activator)